MTTTYTPTDAKRATAQEFADNDAPQAAKINPLGEAAFDTATYAANRVPVYDEVWTSATGTSTGDTTYTGDDDIVIATGVACTSADRVLVTASFGVDGDEATLVSTRLAWQLGVAGGIFAFDNAEFAAVIGAKQSVSLTAGNQIDDGGTLAGNLYVRLQVKTNTGNGYIRGPWGVAIRVMR